MCNLLLMVIVLNESLLHQNGQDVGCRLAVPLLLAAIVLLEGDGVAAHGIERAGAHNDERMLSSLLF